MKYPPPLFSSADVMASTGHLINYWSYHMFKAFNAFITTLFTMLNSFALAGKHIAEWTEESAGSFADEARTNRAAQQLELNKQLKLTNKASSA